MAAKPKSNNPNDFCLPDLGEGLAEAELIEWCVKVGQEVKEHDILARMETAKAVVEVPSPRDGMIATLHGSPGEMVEVGAPLVTYGTPGSNGKAGVGQEPAGVREEMLSAAEDQNGHDNNGEEEDAGTVVGALSEADEEDGHRIKAVPKVRKLAKDLGVDLDRVVGTGIGGRITSRDVHAAAERPQVVQPLPPRTPPPPPVVREIDRGSEQRGPGGERRSIPIKPPRQHGQGGTPPRNIPMMGRKPAPSIPLGEDKVRIPFRGVRRRIAEHLKQSVLHAVHFTIMDEADATALDSLRRRLMEASGDKISFLPLVAAAVCRVLSGQDDVKFNRLNSTVDEERNEIIQHKAVNLGIATDTEEGLMVPVIPNADQLKVLELHARIAEMARKARERSINMRELSGSTFTISNFGSLAGRFGTPIINHPEAAILAVGRARDGVVVKDGMMGIGKLLPLSLSADHRVIDGGTAAMALAKIIDLIQNPDELIRPK
jgi:pyruvate dehydrogenase E2 component (dihydrolipoamide acetyltransferase)